MQCAAIKPSSIPASLALPTPPHLSFSTPGALFLHALSLLMLPGWAQRVKSYLVEHGQPSAAVLLKKTDPPSSRWWPTAPALHWVFATHLLLPWSCTWSHGSFEFMGGMDSSCPGSQCHCCHPLPAALSLPNHSCTVLFGPWEEGAIQISHSGLGTLRHLFSDRSIIVYRSKHFFFQTSDWSDVSNGVMDVSSSRACLKHSDSIARTSIFLYLHPCFSFPFQAMRQLEAVEHSVMRANIFSGSHTSVHKRGH